MNGSDMKKEIIKNNLLELANEVISIKGMCETLNDSIVDIYASIQKLKMNIEYNENETGQTDE